MTLKKQILQLHNEGKSYREIKNKINCSLSTISYYCNSESKIKNNNRLIKLRKRNKEYVWKIKKEKGCYRCGNKDPRCLDFHHIDAQTKKNTIAQLIHYATSIKKIQEEIDKCEVLCTNCHREKHYTQPKQQTKKCKYIQNFKFNTQCTKCGHKGIASLTFHHLKQKDFNIGMKHYSKSFDEIVSEIEKCIVLCENCHRILHYEEKSGV